MLPIIPIISGIESAVRIALEICLILVCIKYLKSK